MAIREDLVASAAKCELTAAQVRARLSADSRASVLQDPSVASSPIEKKVAFLQAKNLTQEEVNAALARANAQGAPAQSYTPQPASSHVVQQPTYYGQYPPQYPPYGWQPPPQPVPRRDWRDWFIMATVVSGVSYGLYSLGKVGQPSPRSHLSHARLTGKTALCIPPDCAANAGAA